MSSTGSIMDVNATTFDPFSQTFTLLLGDGTPFNVSIPDLDDFILYSVQISISYASQLGASLVLLVIMALLTKPDKRFSPIFILNALSLALNFVRNVLQCVYFTGPFSETYAYFAQDYSRVPKSAYATSVATTVLTLLLLICVEISLLLQAQVICITLKKVYRQALFVISLLIALMAIGFRFALCVENSKDIYSLSILTPLEWLVSATNITTTISIFWFCLVFVTKLGFALVQRRKLGLRRFGPMHIIFIMGCQTLTIPAIFSILEYTTDLPSMDSNVLTLVTIFLPLSSIWAGSSLEGRTQASPRPEIRGKRFGSIFKTNSTGPSHKPMNGPLSPSKSINTETTGSPRSSPVKDQFYGKFVDLEAQCMKDDDLSNTFGIAEEKS